MWKTAAIFVLIVVGLLFVRGFVAGAAGRPNPGALATPSAHIRSL